jgi:NAD(P)-dependent dehydrogenase (short-subunit alcohol dehydrogenase family)
MTRRRGAKEGAMRDLSKSIAVVTGAGGGIGRAIARRLHAEGTTVVALDVAGSEAQTAAELGERAWPMRADVSSAREVATAFDAVRARFGRLDVLCNVAGGLVGTKVSEVPLHELSEQDFDRMLAVNLKGVYLCMKYALPLMLESGGGAIINMASVGHSIAAPALHAYAAAKAGVVMLTKSVAVDYGPQNIEANAICPGFVETPAARGFLELHREALLAATPTRRLAQPEEIAELALFLARGGCRSVTGATLYADNALTCL